MSTFLVRPQFVVGGKTFSQNSSLNVNVSSVLDPPAKIPVAKSGSLTTRTDADTGVVTLSAGHGVVTGDRVDLYWDVGGVKGNRRGMAATVAVNAVTVDAGVGDDLPVATSPIILAVAQQFDIELTGNNMIGLTVFTEKRGCFVLTDNANALIFGRHLAEDGGTWGWWNTSGDANPVAGGAIGKIWLSHQDLTAARVMRFGYAY